MSGRQTYMRSYYEDNKEKILQRRRDRYKTDPEFRERLCANRRESMSRRRLLGGHAKPAPKRSTGLEMVLSVQGKTVKVAMFNLSEVASKAAVTRNRLQIWANQDWFFAPSWRNTRGHKLYTQYETEIIVNLVSSYRSILTLRGYSFRVTKQMKEEFAALKKTMIQGVPISALKNAE